MAGVFRLRGVWGREIHEDGEKQERLSLLSRNFPCFVLQTLTVRNFALTWSVPIDR